MYTATCGILLLRAVIPKQKKQHNLSALQYLNKKSAVFYRKQQPHSIHAAHQRLASKKRLLELVSCYASHIDYRVLYTEHDEIQVPREHTSIC